jgi:hypothetical protein
METEKETLAAWGFVSTPLPPLRLSQPPRSTCQPSHVTRFDETNGLHPRLLHSTAAAAAAAGGGGGGGTSAALPATQFVDTEWVSLKKVHLYVAIAALQQQQQRRHYQATTAGAAIAAAPPTSVSICFNNGETLQVPFEMLQENASPVLYSGNQEDPSSATA